MSFYRVCNKIQIDFFLTKYFFSFFSSPSPTSPTAPSHIGKATGSLKSNSSRISSYQNTDGLVGIGNRADKSGTDPRNKKKPVPLPRSKLPTSEIVSASPPLQQQQQPAKSSFFQRSKTDLGSDALSKYKAKRSPGPGGANKYPAPKVPTFNRPIPQKRSLTSSISEVPAQAKVNNLVPVNNRGQRPVLKEKPAAFSTFKTSSTSKKAEVEERTKKATSKTLLQEARMSRAASEGDILGQLIEESAKEELENETVINKNDVKNDNNALTNDKVTQLEVTKLRESDFKKLRSEPLTITSEPLVDKTSLENVSEWMDKSCSTSFESNEGSMMMSTTAERSTDVSMEEQDLYSLESCAGQGRT